MSGCEPWPVTWSCPTDDIPPELLDMAASLSAQLLWAMSGYRVGRCEYTESFVMPGEGVCGYPYKSLDGNWHNGRYATSCRILLTNRPVASITEVVDNGVILDPDEYALEGSWLRRRGGTFWTASIPCGDPEVIVTYQAGVAFPPGTAAAVGEVACEYLLAMQGEQCRLPSRAMAISRQGVTVTLDSVKDFVDRRRIGLPIADTWLDSLISRGVYTRAFTVGGSPRVNSRSYSPDLARGTPTRR